jgi:hypothetical protein
LSKTADDAVTLSCHCGAIEMTLSHAPNEVTECNCSLCRRYGVLWAYYEKDEVTLSSQPFKTDTYAWNGRHVDFHRCATCGCVTHWAPRATRRTQLGLNARLLDPDVVAGAKRLYKDGAGTGKFLG